MYPFLILGFVAPIMFLQVWCILLDDKVPFRVHWPLQSDMQVNGTSVGLPYVYIFPTGSCRTLCFQLVNFSLLG
jgi:hypothetical protein